MSTAVLAPALPWRGNFQLRAIAPSLRRIASRQRALSKRQSSSVNCSISTSALPNATMPSLRAAA